MACPYEEWCRQASLARRACRKVKHVSAVRLNGEVSVVFSNDRGVIDSVEITAEKERLAPFARAVAATFPGPNYKYTAAPADGGGRRSVNDSALKRGAFSYSAT